MKFSGYLEDLVRSTTRFQKLDQGLFGRMAQVPMQSLNCSNCVLPVAAEQLDQNSSLLALFRNRTSKVIQLGNLRHHQSRCQDRGHRRLIAFHVPSSKSKTRCMAFKCAMLMIPLTSKLKLPVNTHLGGQQAGGLPNRFPKSIPVQTFTSIATLIKDASKARQLAQGSGLP